MKKHWFVRIVCIALFSLHSYSAPAQEVLGPKMVLKEQEFDFKEVKEGEIIKHTFQVLNEGDERLEIKKVSPG
jgi:hypothetical protein